MSLAALLIVREDVPAPSGGGASISFRGLSYFDIVTLLEAHRADFATAVPIIRDALSNRDSANLLVVAGELAKACPDLVAHALALAADSPEDAGAFAMVPLGFQLEAVVKVAGLTFRDPSALPKLLASLTTGLTKMTALAQSIPTR